MERKGTLSMSQKERERLRVLELVRSTGMKLTKGAELLRISYRQCKRIWRRYKEEGDAGLIHRARGRHSNRGKGEAFWEEVVRRYHERYPDFGPTLASEKLEEDGYTVDHETLRRHLMREGLWAKQRKRKGYRSWRERKAHRGEMVQMDGSHHDWFEGRGDPAVLMDMVDDATSDAFGLFHKGERTMAAMETLWEYIEEYGIPQSLYVDWHRIFATDREPTIEEQLRGEMPLTQFGRAAEKLGIKIILASSPQAKGRVERKNGVFQDRLVKEMRLRGISTIEEGNALLRGGFLKELNERFAVEPKSGVDFHRPVPEGLDLRTVFCFEEERVVANDWTVRWKNRMFQITRGDTVLPPARRKVIVQEWLDGSIHIEYRGNEVQFKEIAARPHQEKQPVKVSGEITCYKPPADHPWRQYRNRARLAASPQ